MGRNATLLNATMGDLSLLRKVVLVLGGSLFIALAAQVSVPMLPVPMTLQTLAILIVGFAFGSRLGAATVLVYLAQGAMGLPVFTPTTLPGLAAFAGPTAGFLVGFVGMAWLVGRAVERGLARGVVSTALVSLAATAMLYLPGIAWPMLLGGAFGLEAGWIGQAFTGYYWAYFIAPFLIGDVVKAVMAALVVTGAWKALKR